MTDDDFEAQLKKSIKKGDEDFKGQYAAQLKALSDLKEDDIKKITPDTTAMTEYQKLIAVVQDATERNLSQAALKERVLKLGDVAVSIAKSVSSLALKIGL